MALNVLSAPTGINLQGSNYNLQGSLPISNPAVGSSIASSATAPATPKQAYINNQVKQSTAPATPTPVGPSQLTFANGQTYNAQGQLVNGNQTSQSTTRTTSPVYNPYTSPAFQQYVQNAVAAQQSALNNSQIQTGLVSANQGLQALESNYSNEVQENLDNPNLSEGALTGQNAALAQVLANKSVPYQTQINLLNQQQQQATAAANTELNAANASAGFQAGLETPQSVSTGNQLVQLNPSTGQATTIASQPSFGLGTGIAGQPITYNQNTGAINSGGTGLGTTPPILGTQTGEQSALEAVAQTYGLTDPSSQLALQTAVQNTLASNGDVNAAGVPANLQPAVKAVLSQMSGGAYSPGNATINQTNLASEQATANELIAPAQTATQHLADLQSLANAVGYTNSPIASNIRNQFSGSILTDPSITTLQSAIGVVRSEVAKVLGGGSPTVASQAEAAAALPDNLSPENIAGVIANVQQLMDAKVQEYSNPSNAASLPTGLQMPVGYSASIPVGSLTINPNNP